MGVERSVTRWYVKRQLLLNEIAQLEIALAINVSDETNNHAQLSAQQRAEKTEQLTRTRKQLQLLGPCPKPAMV